MVEANHWLGGIMDRTLPSMVARVPLFPAQLAQPRS
jgi:hydroxymethylglutaryl-CoA lyase